MRSLIGEFMVIKGPSSLPFKRPLRGGHISTESTPFLYSLAEITNCEECLRPHSAHSASAMNIYEWRRKQHKTHLGLSGMKLIEVGVELISTLISSYYYGSSSRFGWVHKVRNNKSRGNFLQTGLKVEMYSAFKWYHKLTTVTFD